VVYIFERKTQNIQIEVRYLNASQVFQITCRFADGTTRQETFSGEASFRLRLVEIRTELERDAWGTAGPQLLTDGWKL